MIFVFTGSSILTWLESSSLALFFRQSVWMYPILEIVHIAGFSVLVGAAILFDLRLLGFSKNLPVTECIRHMLFWARLSFWAVLPSGIILFIVDATGMASNPAFILKLVLIGIAIVNAFIFHRYTLKTVDVWNKNETAPVSAKIAGITSILLWLAVISCGRLIAYI